MKPWRRRHRKQREAYLAQACQDDAALRAEVEALLSTLSKADDFFKGLLVGPEMPEDSVSEAVGTIVGRYKLLEQIGEGGMAVVYMAEQQRADPPQGGPEDHQAGHGYQAGHRPV